MAKKFKIGDCVQVVLSGDPLFERSGAASLRDVKKKLQIVRIRDQADSYVVNSVGRTKTVGQLSLVKDWGGGGVYFANRRRYRFGEIRQVACPRKK